MTKRIIAAVLAALMLLALVACSDDKPKPPVSTGDKTQTTTAAPGGDKPNNNPGQPVVYQPDPNCPYTGYVGFGTSAGTALFDDFAVGNLGKQSIRDLIKETTFEADTEVPAFKTLGSTDAVTLETVADPTEKVAEGSEAKNHAATVSGKIVTAGEANWNLYKYSVKVVPVDESAVVELYFCVTDENNYYVLVLGEDGNTKVNCYQAKDGKREAVQFAYPYEMQLTAWTKVGININAETITIYIDGKVAFDLFNEEFINNYCEYDGDVIPGSIEKGGFGAPNVGLTVLTVEEDHVLHDGKGTWGNNLANIASKVFDNDPATFYDCDENKEKPNTDDAAFGIAGDESHATGYVGAKFDDAVVLKYIRYAARSDNANRVAGAIIEASTDGETWTKIGEVTESSSKNEYHTIMIKDETAYNYVRWVGAAGCYCNVSELEFWVEK